MRTLQIVNIVCAVTIADQELFTFVLTMPPKIKLKRPDNQGLISDKFSSDVDGKLCSDDDDTRSTICVESDSVTFVTGCLSDSGPGNV